MIFLGRVTNAYPIIGRTLLFSALREFLMAFQGALCGLRPLPYWIANPEKRHRLSTANINLKRLPQLDEGLDVPAKLGLSSEVAGMLGLLWMGMVDRGMARSSLHTDVQDNILMELVSETEVTVVPREIFWGKNDLAEVTGSYYRVNLKPGEGIAIPSNFLHSVHHLHLDRLGVLAQTRFNFSTSFILSSRLSFSGLSPVFHLFSPRRTSLPLSLFFSAEEWITSLNPSLARCSGPTPRGTSTRKMPRETKSTWPWGPCGSSPPTWFGRDTIEECRCTAGRWKSSRSCAEGVGQKDVEDFGVQSFGSLENQEVREHIHCKLIYSRACWARITCMSLALSP